jgi:hypothetical protein
MIWRGRTDSVNAQGNQHEGQSTGLGTGSAGDEAFHVDPRVLDGATTTFGKRRLLINLLHEPAHTIFGADHDTSWAAINAGYPSDPFFRTLHAASACLI